MFAHKKRISFPIPQCILTTAKKKIYFAYIWRKRSIILFTYALFLNENSPIYFIFICYARTHTRVRFLCRIFRVNKFFPFFSRFFFCAKFNTTFLTFSLFLLFEFEKESVTLFFINFPRNPLSKPSHLDTTYIYIQVRFIRIFFSFDHNRMRIAKKYVLYDGNWRWHRRQWCYRPAKKK